MGEYYPHKRFTRSTLIAGGVTIALMGFLAWSPWITDEFAYTKIKQSLKPPCQEYYPYSVPPKPPLKTKTHPALFGTFYYLHIYCPPTSQSSSNRYFVSSFGTVHQVSEFEYWVNPTPSPQPKPPYCPDGSQTSRSLKPVHTKITSSHKRDYFRVRFIDNSGVRLRNGKLVSITGVDLRDLNNVLSQFQVQIERSYSSSEEELDREREALQGKSCRRLLDLNLAYLFRVPEDQDNEKFIDMLNALPIVELAEPPAIISLPRSP